MVYYIPIVCHFKVNALKAIQSHEDDSERRSMLWHPSLQCLKPKIHAILRGAQYLISGMYLKSYQES